MGKTHIVANIEDLTALCGKGVKHAIVISLYEQWKKQNNPKNKIKLKDVCKNCIKKVWTIKKQLLVGKKDPTEYQYVITCDPGEDDTTCPNCCKEADGNAGHCGEYECMLYYNLLQAEREISRLRGLKKVDYTALINEMLHDVDLITLFVEGEIEGRKEVVQGFCKVLTDPDLPKENRKDCENGRAAAEKELRLLNSLKWRLEEHHGKYRRGK